ncbi:MULTISPECIES: helix-turn-helix domain-containing protein [Microbacterium]|uniref:Helix-turn-helix domain-containing protein n=1 Tax=Microbacterium resistens TaxID=156977 RepID=A0ABY3RNS6_9MICO|nr:helix-turn-helix domain-containing protein [Microbacterium resistens]MDA4894385.1 helix-turn-helix domain-containing protein [Streptomyces sp. MS2A]UGS25599.1 helix-turn-helix domain-containing protein [Microbacterium resistens]
MKAEVQRTIDFGIVAAARREALGLSQRELAERAGVTRDWLARFETGAPNVTVARMMRVYRELELELIVQGDGPI